MLPTSKVLRHKCHKRTQAKRRQTVVVGQEGAPNIYGVVGYKILSIHALLVDVKYEFNSDNRRLDASRLPLAEGKFKIR
jgi:hypothetical protein